MASARRLSAYLMTTVSVLAIGFAAKAADLSGPTPIPTPVSGAMPAVSALNGKWELDVGSYSGSGTVFRGSGSLSAPIGDRFGIQGDFTLGSTGGFVSGGGALHVFTRDPSRYLLGVTGGVVSTNGGSLWAVGPEAELYAGRFSFEAWGGYAAANLSAPASNSTGGFFIGDLAYYPTDDWRLSIGLSSVLGDSKLRLGTEYQLHNTGMPLSLTADARLGGSGSVVTVGIKGYFGGNNPGKSLIDRHRQDDPHNKAVDLFNAASSLGKGGSIDPEKACEDSGGDWEQYYNYVTETYDYECVHES
jgi:hypothetical protein